METYYITIICLLIASCAYMITLIMKLNGQIDKHIYEEIRNTEEIYNLQLSLMRIEKLTEEQVKLVQELEMLDIKKKDVEKQFINDLFCQINNKDKREL